MKFTTWIANILKPLLVAIANKIKEKKEVAAWISIGQTSTDLIVAVPPAVFQDRVLVLCYSNGLFQREVEGFTVGSNSITIKANYTISYELIIIYKS